MFEPFSKSTFYSGNRILENDLCLSVIGNNCFFTNSLFFSAKLKFSRLLFLVENMFLCTLIFEKGYPSAGDIGTDPLTDT